MKKVLIVSYHFPPSSQIGGTRPYGLAKYLPAFGWKATVLTPQIEGRSKFPFRVIETQYTDLLDAWKRKAGFNPNQSASKTLKLASKKNRNNFADFAYCLIKNLFLYPDRHVGWYDHAVKVGGEILENENFDAIISTAHPPTCHLVAERLSKTYRLAWIADFRDLWVQDFYKSGLDSFMQRLRGTEGFERTLLSQTEAITTVSEPLAATLRSLHRDKQIYAIPNGFDPAEMDRKPVSLSSKFTVTYTGNLYRGKRDPGCFFKALQESILDGIIDLKKIEVLFYCPSEDWLVEDISRYQLDSIVKLCGMVPKQSAIEKQRQSHLLLLLLWNHPREKGVYTGKIFEYLAGKRPILCVNGPDEGVVKDLLVDTGAGTYCNSQESIKESLITYYLEYQKFGSAQYQGVEEVINRYSHSEMAKKFAEILDNITR